MEESKHVSQLCTTVVLLRFSHVNIVVVRSVQDGSDWLHRELFYREERYNKTVSSNEHISNITLFSCDYFVISEYILQLNWFSKGKLTISSGVPNPDHALGISLLLHFFHL